MAVFAGVEDGDEQPELTADTPAAKPGRSCISVVWYCRVRLREQVTWVAYDSRENGVFQRHAQLGDITRPRPVAAQLLYARCRSSATAEQALSPHRRGQVQDAPKCARVRVIVVAAAAGAVLLRPVPWSDAALRQP